MYLVRGKVDSSLTAEVSLHQGKKEKWFMETNARQFFKPQKSAAPLEAGSAVTLHEISGPCSCIAKDLSPTAWLLWVAVVETPTDAYTLKFEGHAPVVREWRDEFVTLVKSAR